MEGETDDMETSQPPTSGSGMVAAETRCQPCWTRKGRRTHFECWSRSDSTETSLSCCPSSWIITDQEHDEPCSEIREPLRPA